MNKEDLKKHIEGFLFSGKDPFIIANDLADYIETNFQENKKGKFTEVVKDTEKWIDIWMNIFPTGVKSGGKLLRSDKKICLTKMAKFRLDYPEYSVEDILEATEQYIEEQRKKDYDYTTCAVNFIQHKEKGSELAARCRDLQVSETLTGEEVHSNDFFI